MKDLSLNVPTRNVLTGAVVNWEDDELAGLGDTPENLTLAWKDLCVYRKKKYQTSIWRSAVYEEIKVLHGVSGVVSSGNLVALMGSSGAGKTTLLAAISRRDKSAMSGYLMLNGRLAGADLIARISGFLPQEDLSIDDLTVSEHMEFMARLMMDKRSTKSIRSRRVEQLLGELGVANCTRTKLKALSGGERKRVALAVQLLNDPPILFCDEPTTGLDSFAANAVVSRLRRLAAGGKLVICSVHQPASGVFELFHQVVLLASGRIAFHGTIEQADQFFASMNYKCPVGFNAAEYYVTLLGIEADKELESRERIRRICNEYQRSSIAEAIENRVGDVKDEMEYFNGSGDEKNIHFERYLTLVKVNYFVQFYWLLWRNIQTIKHNKVIWIAEFLLFLFVGLIISIPYAGHFSELDQRDIQNAEGLLYLVITETTFLFIYAVFITFPSEVPILLRETASGLYSPLPYYLSKMIFWIPRAVIEPILFATLVFTVAGLQGGFYNWLGISFICVLCANYANAYGSFLSSVFDKMETAALVSVPFELVGTMFSGIYLNLGSASPYISWLRYISAFYYGVEAISIVQWDSIESINCVNIKGMPCIKTGPDVLRRYGFSEEHFWRNCICLTSMYFIAHFISFLMVVKRSRGTPVY
ncbi:protein scarlet-like [Danaus plexippus]|uniref:Scarlet like protein n=1 Tax=Danaus plexippus plexippus TaxID=278856 RepID=A0A212F822_DANPL|nr:protein scarlet-like [Danaus plexippus]XP_032529214.1 protein scarlet-like [Danaus plexippus]OWR49892.1 scarlet like protein [Danaus plexippus plexippus]